MSWKPDRSSDLYCLSNPETLIRGGVLRVGSDSIPAVKLLPDPAHLPLKLECLYRGGCPRHWKLSGMWNVIGDGWWLWNKFCIRWWAHAQILSFIGAGRLLYWVESLPTHKGSVPIRARARTGEARTSWSKTPLFWIMRKTFENWIKPIKNLIIC